MIREGVVRSDFLRATAACVRGVTPETLAGPQEGMDPAPANLR